MLGLYKSNTESGTWTETCQNQAEPEGGPKIHEGTIAMQIRQENLKYTSDMLKLHLESNRIVVLNFSQNFI